MGIILKRILMEKYVYLTDVAQDMVQYLDHVNLKSRGFLDPLSQACDEERVPDTCNKQLSGTNGGLASCRCLYSKYICADYCKPKPLIL